MRQLSKHMTAPQPQRFGKDPDASNELFIRLEEGITKILQQQEECVEEQRQQRQLFKEQLEILMVEQASLRSLLMQNSNSKPRNTAASSAAQSDIKPTESPVSKPAVALKQKTLKVVEKAAGKYALVDPKCLPEDWNYGQEVIEQSANDCVQRARGIARSKAFDAFSLVIIFSYVVTIVTQLHCRGYYSAVLMGTRADDAGWKMERKQAFESLDWFFTVVFAVEAVLRVSLLGFEYLRHAINAFDTFVVLLSFIFLCILEPAGLTGHASFIVIARFVKLISMLRLLRFLRLSERFSPLRVLVRALSSSGSILFWSLVFLNFFIMGGAIILCQIVLGYVENEEHPLQQREWLHENLGTFYLCVIALWESALVAPAWFRYSQKMIQDVSPFFALFWVPFFAYVNFAMVRLVGALFLKETLTVAAIDNDKCAAALMKKKRKYAESIKAIFEEADTSGDGKISAQELQEALHNPRIQAFFRELDLEVSEVAKLFERVAEDDGFADYQEFLEGSLILKQSARTIDLIQVAHGHFVLADLLAAHHEEMVGILEDYMGKRTATHADPGTAKDTRKSWKKVKAKKEQQIGGASSSPNAAEPASVM